MNSRKVKKAMESVWPIWWKTCLKNLRLFGSFAKKVAAGGKAHTYLGILDLRFHKTGFQQTNSNVKNWNSIDLGCFGIQQMKFEQTQ